MDSPYSLVLVTGSVKLTLLIKAKLELKGIKVEMKTKQVENTSEYKDKEEQIIDQEPKFDKEKETKLYAKDTVTLYIPEVDVYPDMVKEKWTLSKAQDFASENNITLDITYKETTDVEENIILFFRIGIIVFIVTFVITFIIFL